MKAKRCLILCVSDSAYIWRLELSSGQKEVMNSHLLCLCYNKSVKNRVHVRNETIDKRLLFPLDHDRSLEIPLQVLLRYVRRYIH